MNAFFAFHDTIPSIHNSVIAEAELLEELDSSNGKTNKSKSS